MQATSGRGARTMARAIRTLIAGACAGLGLLALLACTPIVRNHGFAPTDAELSVLTVGKDTRDTVAESVGRPSTAGLLDDTAWFYVQSRWEQVGPRAPVEISREVVVISFDEAGVLQNIERFGLESGRVVALSRRVTDTNIKGVTLAQQLLGSLGRVTAGQLIQ